MKFYDDEHKATYDNIFRKTSYIDLYQKGFLEMT